MAVRIRTYVRALSFIMIYGLLSAFRFIPAVHLTYLGKVCPFFFVRWHQGRKCTASELLEELG